MTQLVFPTPPKRFKKVKSVKVRVLHDFAGKAVFDSPVTVYMDMSGTPEFVVFVPDQYAAEWDLHGDSDRAGFYVHNGNDADLPRAIRAATFDDAIKHLEQVSLLFSQKVRSRTLKKVIGIGLEASIDYREGDDKISHNPPSFSKSDSIVGIRSRVYFEVNGKLYSPRREFDESNPDFNELSPSSACNYDRIIPYSDEAWLTICRVDDALRNAAKMLHNLITSDQTESLLIGGLSGLLLSAPASQKGGAA